MSRLRLLLAAVPVATAVLYVSSVALPPVSSDEHYGPAVPPASIITLDPAEDARLFPATSTATPQAEQGEGGPDEYPVEAWWVPPAECIEVRALLAEHDLIGPTADRLVWLARAESDCGAQRVNEASEDYGLWQINWPTWGGPLCANADICTTPWELAHDDDVQAEAVAVLLDWQGWSAWCWSTADHHARGIGYQCPWNNEEQG